jgi:hypothetical protein
MLNDDPLGASLAEARRATRDQVTAIWQAQMERIRDAISRDWREQIAAIVEDRFTEFESLLKPAILESRREVVRSLGRHWNDCFLRMRDSTTDREWCESLLDAAAGLSKRCLFFSLRGETLSLQGLRGFEPQPRVALEDIPVQSAPAFLEVGLSGVATETSRRADDISTLIAALVADSRDLKAILVPVSAQDRVMGILYAENALEQSALEAVALVAGIILSSRISTESSARPSNIVRSLANSETIVRPAQFEPPLEPEPLPVAVLASRPAHPKAERAARVHAAHLLLDHYASVRQAIADTSLDADLAQRRAAYLREFPDHAAYLDIELGRTLGRVPNNA